VDSFLTDFITFLWLGVSMVSVASKREEDVSTIATQLSEIHKVCLEPLCDIFTYLF
jgi:hypothetical protein